MKQFVIIAAFCAIAFARPDGILPGNDGFVSVTQNTLGNYKYEVHLKDGIRSEERLADGSVVGKYYVPDDSGVPRLVEYTSGVDGFRIIGDGVAPIETPEVRAERERFLEAYQRALV